MKEVEVTLRLVVDSEVSHDEAVRRACDDLMNTNAGWIVDAQPVAAYAAPRYEHIAEPFDELVQKVGLVARLVQRGRDGANWAAVADMLFSPRLSGRIEELFRKLGVTFEFVDRDSSHQGDAEAYAEQVDETFRSLAYKRGAWSALSTPPTPNAAISS